MDTAATAAQKTAGGITLRDAMKAAGFSVGDTTEAYINNSYGKFSLSKYDDFTNAEDLYGVATISAHAAVTNTPVEKSPEWLYMVVSNNGGKSPDAVISLNLQTSNLTGVDNVNTIKTVTVPFATGASTMIDGNDDWPYIAADNVLTATAGADVKGGALEQRQLVGNSAKTLGAKEIGLHITGAKAYTPERTGNNAVTSSDDYDTNWFKLTPVTQTEGGVVVAYNNSVTLSDGAVLAKSIVYDTVVAGTIPQVDVDTYAGALKMGTAAFNVSTNTDLLYFTENTKFILVSGYGTDSLKTEVFDGISELKGNSDEVQINMHYTVNNTVAASLGSLAAVPCACSILPQACRCPT